MSHWCALLRDERAGGMVEYAVVIGGLVLGALAILLSLSGWVNNLFANTNTLLGTLPNS